MSGPVSLNSREYRFWGIRALILVILAYVAILIFQSIGVILGIGIGVIASLIYLACCLAVISIAIGLLLRTHLLALFFAVAQPVVDAIRFAAWLFGYGAAAGAKGGAGLWRAIGSSRPQVPLRRFRVQSSTGEITSCVLLGELGGGDVRSGDWVQVVGRRSRSGHYRIRRLEVLQSLTGPAVSVMKAGAPRHLVFLIWADRLALLLAGAVAVLIGLRLWVY